MPQNPWYDDECRTLRSHFTHSVTVTTFSLLSKGYLSFGMETIEQAQSVPPLFGNRAGLSICGLGRGGFLHPLLDRGRFSF